MTRRPVTPRPSAAPGSLLRALQAAQYSAVTGIGKYRRYSVPCIAAMTEHRDLLEATHVGDSFIEWVSGNPSPWRICWEKVAAVIGAPLDLGQEAVKVSV